ncbi:immunoglobulin-like domain-containing protein [Arcticibacter eurypsychrophilus]|uniref:immunoglobulin-like domain-containing protein n=1 Tax=Arcticibacter eurypsychrophilus TaxID=1434752 RepID=UPI00084D59F7|nr:immunoglobulin-like domain-containing protein [Arcticibacter eurypsychrophilus]
MKKNINLIALLLLSISIFSCKKDDFNYPEGHVGISKITNYPIITLKGDLLTFVNQGTTYTDAGVTAMVGETSVEFTSSGTVNTAVPGVYVIDYAAKNEDGFAATAYRSVIVMSTSADIPNHNYSGTYDRYAGGSPNGQTSTWTKTGNGVYTVANPGGATGVTVTAVNYSGNLIAIPQQETSAGTMSSSGGVYNPTASPLQYVWTILNATYGTSPRTFVKK